MIKGEPHSTKWCIGILQTYLRSRVVNTDSAATPDAREGEVIVQSEDRFRVVEALDQLGLVGTPEKGDKNLL